MCGNGHLLATELRVGCKREALITYKRTLFGQQVSLFLLTISLYKISQYIAYLYLQNVLCGSMGGMGLGWGVGHLFTQWAASDM